MKCQWCGNGAVRQEGQVLAEAVGPDATVILEYQGKSGLLMKHACDSCAKRAEKIGWKRQKK